MAAESDYFTDRVRGRVRAALILNEEGEPRYIESDGRRHYMVELSLVTANPDVRNVLYKLDPTYYNSIRESKDAEKNFAVDITTYGDYDLVVDVTVGSEGVRQRFLLSHLLEETHAADTNPQVGAALSTIKQN